MDLGYAWLASRVAIADRLCYAQDRVGSEEGGVYEQRSLRGDSAVQSCRRQNECEMAEYQAEKYIGKPLRSIPGCCSHNAFDDVK